MIIKMHNKDTLIAQGVAGACCVKANDIIYLDGMQFQQCDDSISNHLMLHPSDLLNLTLYPFIACLLDFRNDKVKSEVSMSNLCAYPVQALCFMSFRLWHFPRTSSLFYKAWIHVIRIYCVSFLRLQFHCNCI